MKKTRAPKKLLLSVERVRTLQASRLSAAVGGAACNVTNGPGDTGGGGGSAQGDLNPSCGITDCKATTGGGCGATGGLV